MRRRLPNIVAWFSLLMFMLLAVAQVHWVFHAYADSYVPLLEFALPGRNHVVLSNSLGVHHRTRAGVSNSRYAYGKMALDWQRFGFDVWMNRLVNLPAGDGGTVEWGPVAEWNIGVPCWLLLVATAVLPVRRAVSAVRFIRRLGQSDPPGTCCTRCGYDLRATPARCPECGTDASVSNSG